MNARREELKVAKANHKQAMKNKVKYERDRDALLMQIVESPVPKWGNIKIIVSPLK